MGKEEVLDLCATFMLVEDIDGLIERMEEFQKAFEDIINKKSYFMQDTFQCILRKLREIIANQMVDSEGQSIFSQSDGKILVLFEKCGSFLEPFLKALSNETNVGANSEIDRQRGLIIAYILELYAIVPRSTGDIEQQNRQILQTLLCKIKQTNIELHSLLATCRYRKDIENYLKLMLPSLVDRVTEEDYEEEEQEEKDKDDNDIEKEDAKWLEENMPDRFGLRHFYEFITPTTSTDNHILIKWNEQGICSLIIYLFHDSKKETLTMLSPLVTAETWLFLVSGYITSILELDTLEDRKLALVIILRILQQCSKDTFKCPRTVETTQGEKTFNKDFKHFSNELEHYDWMLPLIQMVTNTLVSFPAYQDRMLSLQVLDHLLLLFTLRERFILLQYLVMSCPYKNVSAVLLDRVRGDLLKRSELWCQEQVSIEKFAFKMLEKTSTESNLVLHTDLIISVLNLVRLLFIKVQVQKEKKDFIQQLDVLERRLQQCLQETHVPPPLRCENSLQHLPPPSTSIARDPKTTDSDLSRLFILQAALEATKSCLDR